MSPDSASVATRALKVLTPQGPLFTRTEAPGTSNGRLGRTVVLMLHALGTDMTIWDGLAMQLREVCTVIRVDAPGHGQSPAWLPADVTLDTLAQSVLGVVEQLAPDARVDLLGTSMGAVVALRAASLAPARVRKLVLCGALLIRSSDAATDMRQRSAALLKEGMGPLTERLLARWFPPRSDGDDVESIAHLRSLMCNSSPDAYAACSDALSTYDLSDAVLARQKDILLISGDADGDIPRQFAALHAAMPGCAHVCMPDTGHFPHLQRPQAFADLATDFLQPARIC